MRSAPAMTLKWIALMPIASTTAVHSSAPNPSAKCLSELPSRLGGYDAQSSIDRDRLLAMFSPTSTPAPALPRAGCSCPCRTQKPCLRPGVRSPNPIRASCLNPRNRSRPTPLLDKWPRGFRDRAAFRGREHQNESTVFSLTGITTSIQCTAKQSAS